MKKAVVLIVLGMLLAPLYAQEKPSAEKLKLAGQVIELNGTGQNLKRMIDNYHRKCEGLMERYLAKAQDQKEAEKVKKELREAIKDSINFDEIKDETIMVYAENFSESELKDIIAFYNTPTGKKLLQVNPALGRQITDILAKYSRESDKKAMEILKKKVPVQVPTEAHFVPIGRIPAQPQDK